MTDIKTRDISEKTIKALNRSMVVGERMKDAYVRTKDTAENPTEEYAADKYEGAVRSTTQEAVHQFNKQGRKGIATTKESISKEKVHLQNIPPRADRPSVKTSKGIQGTGKVAVKTSEQTAKIAKASARRAKKISKIPATVSSTATKVVQSIISAVKSLVSIILAGGWIAVVIMIVVCVIAMVVGSVFGIFFSNEDTGSAYSMQSVITEINNEYLAQIESLKSRYTYDELEMSGTTAAWKEVLSVYSVKVTTDPNNATETATIDYSKKALIREIFWLMNTLTARTETKTETVVAQTVDEHGNVVETTTTVTKVYLYITVTHKSTEKMADHYGFNDEQRAQLAELLLDKNHSMWEGFLARVG